MRRLPGGTESGIWSPLTQISNSSTGCTLKSGGFIITLPNTGTVSHRNTNYQDNLLKRIVLKICHHLRTGSSMPTVGSTYALGLETKLSSFVKLPFQVLLRSEAFVGNRAGRKCERAFHSRRFNLNRARLKKIRPCVKCFGLTR
jgi:hypothetical protein